MEDDLKKTTAENPAAEEQAEKQSAPEAETSADETQRKIDELTAQYQQMRERAARAQADAEREMKRLKAYGSERAILAMLPVFDNLERALDSAEADPASIKEGVRMVRQQFADALKDLGVTELDPAGKPFSPAEHDAMGMVPVSDKSQDGLVHTVVRKGFQMAEKVIRPALVMVARYAENKPEGNGEQQ